MSKPCRIITNSTLAIVNTKLLNTYQRYRTPLLLGLSALALVLLGILWSEYGKLEGRKLVAAAHQRALAMRDELTRYHQTNDRFPPVSSALMIPKLLSDPQAGAGKTLYQEGFQIAVISGTITITFVSEPFVGKTLIYQPRVIGGKLEWDCRGGTVGSSYRAPECHAD